MPTFKSKGTIVSSEIHFSQKHPHHIETSQLIRLANQLTGFYMIGYLHEVIKNQFSKAKHPTVSSRVTLLECFLFWGNLFFRGAATGVVL